MCQVSSPLYMITIIDNVSGLYCSQVVDSTVFFGGSRPHFIGCPDEASIEGQAS